MATPPASSDGSTPIAARYDALFFDLDGVLYRGTTVVREAVPTLRDLRRLGHPLAFLTNNSSQRPEEVSAKLRRIGIQADVQEVVTSAVATASVLVRDGYRGSKAFVIGERGIRDALSSAGIDVVDGEPRTADLVVVGWDRSVTYDKLKVAALLVQRGARLVATNDDRSYPAEDGLWPGAGAILAAVTTATGAEPTVVGKPAPLLLEAAARSVGASHPLIVGDRLETDVAAAARLGWDSTLVFSGAAGPRDLATAALLPTYVGDDVSVVLADVPPARFRSGRSADLPALRRLLLRSGLESEGAETRLDSTLVCVERGAVVATACVVDITGRERPGARGPGLLRSVAVDREFMGKGIGLLVAAAAIQQARRRGIRDLYLFTEGAAGFFSRLGFASIERDRLPQAVQDTAQASRECPESAVAMRLSL